MSVNGASRSMPPEESIGRRLKRQRGGITGRRMGHGHGLQFPVYPGLPVVPDSGPRSTEDPEVPRLGFSRFPAGSGQCIILI